MNQWLRDRSNFWHSVATFLVLEYCTSIMLIYQVTLHFALFSEFYVHGFRFSLLVEMLPKIRSWKCISVEDSCESYLLRFGFLSSFYLILLLNPPLFVQICYEIPIFIKGFAFLLWSGCSYWEKINFSLLNLKNLENLHAKVWIIITASQINRRFLRTFMLRV